MLRIAKVMTFVATNQPDAALAFYRDVLGLAFVEDNGFSLVFDLAGIHLRVQKTRGFTPPPHTALGWEVDDIATMMATLVERGVRFEQVGIPDQDASGVWTAPGGVRVAWFKDPDGNVLSLTQF